MFDGAIYHSFAAENATHREITYPITWTHPQGGRVHYTHAVNCVVCLKTLTTLGDRYHVTGSAEPMATSRSRLPDAFADGGSPLLQKLQQQQQ